MTNNKFLINILIKKLRFRVGQVENDTRYTCHSRGYACHSRESGNLLEIISFNWTPSGFYAQRISLCET